MKAWLLTSWLRGWHLTCRFGGIVAHASFVLPLAIAPALAAAGNFPPRVTLEQDTLERIGQATAHYARIIPVYDIALYTDSVADTSRLLEPGVAKRLDIVYRVAIKATDLARAAEKTLSRQYPQERLEQWQSRVEALHESYRDVQPGDRYTLSYLPRQGLWLEFNGEEMFALEDGAFATVYFGIWLGDKPLSEPLREALLASADKQD